MTQLDRLERWAQQTGAAPVTTPDAGQLFRDGKRWARRQRVVTGAVAAFVVLVLATGGFLLRPNVQSLQPAGPASGELTLPDRVYEVPRRLPELGRGEVAGVLPTIGASGWFGEENVIVGISARTGGYGRLNLPDLADFNNVVLSPGGERLAWPTCGQPSGTAQTNRGEECATTGVAIRDLVTGDLKRLPLKSEHGLSEVSMLWIDDETLAMNTWDWLAGDDGTAQDQSTGVESGSLLWRAGQGTSSVRALNFDGDFSRVVAGKIVTTDERRVRVQDPFTGKVVRSPLQAKEDHFRVMTPPAWSNDLRRVATAGTATRSPGPLRWAEVGTDLKVKKWHELNDPASVLEVRGWRGDAVVVMANGAGDESFLYEVDTTTGKKTELIAYPGLTQSGVNFQWAARLLAEAPTRPGVKPEALRDPRLVVATGSLLIFVSVIGLLWWRGRPRV